MAARRVTRGDEGFTLIELVIALLVISIAIGGLVGVLGTAFKATSIDVHRTDATAIAAAGLAHLEASANPMSGPLAPVTRNGESYTLTATVGLATASNGVADAYPTLAVTVGWSDQGGSHTITQSTARFPDTTPTTTGALCTAPVLSAPPTYNAVASGDPSLDVSWQEPVGGTPVVQWEVQVSPDHATWTTAVADEPPLPQGAYHQVEIGGLAGTDSYGVQVVALTGCADPAVFTAVAGGQPATPAPAATACNPGSVTLGPAVATRSPTGPPPGVLTTDITVVVTSPVPCPSGLWVGAVDTDGSVVTAPLSAGGAGSYSYVGTLAGLTQVWDLGLHQVEIFTGSPVAGPPLPSGAVASAVLCVEQEGTSSC